MSLSSTARRGQRRCCQLEPGENESIPAIPSARVLPHDTQDHVSPPFVIRDDEFRAISALIPRSSPRASGRAGVAWESSEIDY